MCQVFYTIYSTDSHHKLDHFITYRRKASQEELGDDVYQQWQRHASIHSFLYQYCCMGRVYYCCQTVLAQTMFLAAQQESTAI